MAESSSHVVGKVGAVLRVIASSEPDGLTTTEVGTSARVPRATAHRLLVSLADEGLVDRQRETGRWLLGPELYLFGAAASPRYDVTQWARPIVERLSRETGESAFFSARRGDETVCLVREDGSFPLRSHVLYEGIRFPLGVASAGLAILSHLDDRELGEYLERTDLTADWGDSHSRGALEHRIAETRDAGYAVNPGLIVEGSWGMGAAVFDRDGQPKWALSLTGVEQRFRPDRQRTLGTALLEHAHELSRAIG